MTAQALFAKVDTAEQRLCRIANRVCRRSVVRRIFQFVSRLGDGVFWYVLMALMPLFVDEGLWEGIGASVHMLSAAAIGLAVYKALEKKLVRERPYISFNAIECAIQPLDRYSFPSGHTLYAVLFTCIAVTYVPALGVILIPFAVLVAVSRVVLGLHYPSDVLAGALLGWIFARLSWVAVAL